MRKYIRILIISVALLFSVFVSVNFNPKKAFAKEDLYVRDWTIYAALKENGDLKITEDISYEFNEKFNGIYRYIDLNETYSITDIVVKEIESGKLKNFALKEKAKNGDEGVYTVEKKKDKTIIKIFSPSNDEVKTFRISYIINNAATKYNDTGELYYKFLDKDNETFIENFTVYIDLPFDDGSDRVKIFAHGPSNGTINKIDGTYNTLRYQLKTTNVESNTHIETRLLFPPEYIRESTNIVNKDRYQEILAEETALQKISEQQRIKKEFKKALLGRISLIISSISIFVFIVIWVICRRKVEQDTVNRVYKDIPEDCTPALAAYITGLSINANIFFATVLDLFCKGYLKIKRSKDNKEASINDNYIIYKTKDADNTLLHHERYFMTWLFNDLGDGNSVCLKDIENYSRQSPQKFNKAMMTWKNKIKEEAFRRGYFDNSKSVHGLVLITLSVACIILGFITVINKNIIGLFDLAAGIVLLIYGLCLFYRLSYKGYILCRKWKGFTRYMKQLKPNLSAEDVADPLDKSLIYALGFGILKKDILSLGHDFYTEDGWLFWYVLFADTSSNTFSESINNSFADNSSYVGSFSDGGGGGIGGGGTGGF